MFRKLFNLINGGDPSSHSEPVGQMDRWDRGIVTIAGAQHDGFMRALADIDGGSLNLVHAEAN
jgi:hypothetical protein